MSITIEGLEKANDVSSNQNFLQYIPAKISYEGPANVKNFFTNFTSCEENEKNTPLTNVFRGRPLNGKYRRILSKLTPHYSQIFTSFNLDSATEKMGFLIFKLIF